MIYQLTGLHCGACVRRVSQALAGFAQGLEVTLDPMQVRVQGLKHGVSTEDLQMALSAVGNYRISLAAPISHSPVSTATVAKDTTNAVATPLSWWRTYYPLLLILSFILGVSVLAQKTPNVADSMRYFMAGFFLCFAFFKLLDVPAFARAYAGYDLLAARWSMWGQIYPFVELALGIAYLIDWQPKLIYGLTILVMGGSAIGVVRAVMRKEQIQCACLGTVFQLPMSTVTIVEDLAMVLMAGYMWLFA